MVYCCAINCNNRLSAELRKTKGITFHRFPDAAKDEERRKRWIANLRRDKFNPDNKRVWICSQHFLQEMFDRTGQTTRLKPDAVPTLFDFPPHVQKHECRRHSPRKRSIPETHTSEMQHASADENTDCAENCSLNPHPKASHAATSHDHAYHHLIKEIFGKVSHLAHGIRQRDDCEIFTNVEKSSSTTIPMCLGTGNAPLHQGHLPPVPSTEGSSICTFSIPDPLNADGVQVTIDHGEEREGPITEDMQTMGSLVSPAPPLHSSSMKKRRAENKRMGISKRARQLDYDAENTVITEYYKILIEKEKRALEREAEKHKLEKEALERAAEKHKLEKEALERAAERDREATYFFAIGKAVVELLKQKLETELNQ